MSATTISFADALIEFEVLCKKGNFDGAVSAGIQIRAFLAASQNPTEFSDFSWDKYLEALAQSRRPPPAQIAADLRDAVLFEKPIPPAILLYVANLIGGLPAAKSDLDKKIRRYTEADAFVARVLNLTDSLKSKKSKGARQAAFEKIAEDDELGDWTAAEKAFNRAKAVLKTGLK